MSVDKNTDDSHKIKEVMRLVGTPLIQLQLAKYIKQLKEGRDKHILNLEIWVLIAYVYRPPDKSV